MRAPPEGLEEGAVLDALRRGWGFDVESAAYAPVGAGSYHWTIADGRGRRGFVTVDDLGQKAWLGDTPDEVCEGLQRAFDTAVALRESGLEFVVAPIPTQGGESLRRIGARHTVALFPFVDAEAAEWGPYEDDDHRLAVVALVAELHRSQVARTAAAPTVGFALSERRHLEAALQDVDVPWTGGPFSEPARAAVADCAAELAAAVAHADRLAADAQERAADWVVTHGEPHAANVMRAGGRRYLLDWDTVALGPPERDLWMLDGDGAAAAYERATGVHPDEVALEYFRLAWGLKDLAEYLHVLRAPHSENDDTARQYGAVAGYAARASR